MHLFSLSTQSAVAGGQWTLLHHNIGISAMHMQLLHNDRVIIFDRTDFGPSNLSLPDGKCRKDPSDTALKVDCTAHSVEYNVATNTFRPLTVLTDTWCSSGTVSPDGRLIQTGGFNDGDRAVRIFSPCSDNTCDWQEKPNSLAVRRWYATNQILPDGRAFIVGGRRQFNYEFYPNSGQAPVNFPFLLQTHDTEENNLYPFVHLNLDGNLFIFSNNRAILFNYAKNSIVRTYPAIPGGDPRNYPSSGSSVLLPLKPNALEVEVLICGGAPRASFVQASQSKRFARAIATCGRLKITDPSPSWEMEEMPLARVMGDMVLLPSGTDVLIINGAAVGAAGWENAAEPVLNPVVYRPDAPAGSRFATQKAAITPRLYHSTAILIRDGRVLVGGSNPHINYKFSGVEFPTDLSLEAFSPDYMTTTRPKIVAPAVPLELSYGKQFRLYFTVAGGGSGVTVTMVTPSFTTHAFSMNQRLLVLETSRTVPAGRMYEVLATAPRSGALAPAGWYMVFVAKAGVPSEGIWSHIGES